MSLINFDCPECGHNLEVDERGAGFIIKCPECANPLQIPDLPRSHRIRKIAISVLTALVIVLLFSVNLLFWRQLQSQRARAAEQQVFLDDFRQQAQTLSMQQESEIARLTQAVEQAKQASADALSNAALDAIDEAEALSRELEATRRKLLEASPSERSALLREDMRQRVASAKIGLPAAPVVTDAEPGRGVQGRQIVFPLLPGSEGQVLRENAEITGVEGDKVSVKFAGGTATYALTELHPGVAAFLPVDPLFVLPRKKWDSEVVRIQQTLNAQRDQRIAQLRGAIESLLPPSAKP